MSRPPDRTSSEASSLAKMTGLRSGSRSTPVASLTRRVIAARKDNTTTGSASAIFGSNGLSGLGGSGSTGGSPTQNDSYPASSARVATPASASGERVGPELRANNPILGDWLTGLIDMPPHPPPLHPDPQRDDRTSVLAGTTAGPARVRTRRRRGESAAPPRRGREVTNGAREPARSAN